MTARFRGKEGLREGTKGFVAHLTNQGSNLVARYGSMDGSGMRGRNQKKIINLIYLNKIQNNINVYVKSYTIYNNLITTLISQL